MNIKNKEPNSTSRSNQPNNEDEKNVTYFDIQQTDPNFRDQDAEVNLDSIISAPMVAVSKANSIMLSGQVDFIINYCFDKIEITRNGQIEVTYEPKMIHLSITRKDESQNVINDTVKIPLLTLLPINSLAIDKMKVDFSMEITSISSYKATSNDSVERKAQLSGKLSNINTEDNTTNKKQNLSVYVEASKLPLPNGLLNIIDMYSKI